MSEEERSLLERKSRAAFDASVEAQDAPTRSRPAQASPVAFDDLEIVAGGEAFDMLRDDQDFVAWTAAQSADGVG